MTADRLARRLGVAALAAAAAVVALWLGQLGDAPAGGALLLLSRTAALAAAALAVAWLAARFAAAVRAGGERRRRAVALAVLLAVALALRFTGLGHELIDRPYLDEGTYYHHASEIDAGHVFRPTFVYPHLVYYADALWLWVAGLFRGALLWLAARWGPGHGWLEVTWWWLRWLPALAGAAVVVPVYRAAEALAEAASPAPSHQGPSQVGGTWGNPMVAGVFSGLAVAVGPLWNEVSHLNVSDLPAAFFAAVAFAGAARLLRRESAAGYLAAGVAAGLAAVAKYPAGVVALALVAVWLRHRLATRRWHWGIAWAGLAAIGTFVVCMPSLFVFPGEAFAGPRGILFGVRQYAGGGWIGVQPQSHALYYADLVRGELGWAALLAAGAGLFCLTRGEWRRLAWLLPFPLGYLGLVTAMNLVVQRNLLPAIPPLAAFAGVAVAALLRRLSGLVEGRLPALAVRAVVAVAVALLLLPPALVSFGASRALAAPSTRELARDWIDAHVAPGAALLVESYGPRLRAERYAVWDLRFAARVPLDEAAAGGVDFVVLSSAAYGRFLDPAQHSEPQHAVYAAWYEHVFAELPLAARFPPSAGTWGPEIRIHRLPPPKPPPEPSAAPRTAAAGELFLPDHGMRSEADGGSDGGAVVYNRPGQWSAAKLDLAAGRHRLRLAGTAAGAGTVRLASLGGEERGAWRLDAAPGGLASEIVVQRAGRHLLYLELPPGSRLEAVAVEPLAAVVGTAETGENGAPDLSY